MSRFRISLGTASCKGFEARSGLEQAVCELVMARINLFEAMHEEQLSEQPAETTTRQLVNGREVVFTTFKQATQPGAILVVVQAFVPTWRFPTFFSTSGVGKLFVEGIVFVEGQAPRPALDEELWQFR